MDDVVALHAFPLPTERYHAFLLNSSPRTPLTFRWLCWKQQRDGRLILEDHEGEFMFVLLSSSATNANNVSTHPFCTIASTIFHHPPRQARPLALAHQEMDSESASSSATHTKRTVHIFPHFGTRFYQQHHPQNPNPSLRRCPRS
jgi:hypothetical protein